MINIYDPTPEPDVKKNFFLKASDQGDYIKWFLVDRRGNAISSGTVFRMDKKTGELYRYGHINSHCGLDLDGMGRLKTNE